MNQNENAPAPEQTPEQNKGKKKHPLRVLALFVPGIVFFAALLISALFGKGRLWCNWICPVGTVFDAVARLGWHKDRPCRSCANCRRCFS